MQAKLSYQQRYGLKPFLSLLKKHGLHTDGGGNRFAIVNELLKVLDNAGVSPREVAKDEVMVNSEEVTSKKRRRNKLPWLTDIRHSKRNLAPFVQTFAKVPAEKSDLSRVVRCCVRFAHCEICFLLF